MPRFKITMTPKTGGEPKEEMLKMNFLLFMELLNGLAIVKTQMMIGVRNCA